MRKLIVLFSSIAFVLSISSCKKEISLPQVTTGDATEIQYQTATLNGEITDNGGGTVSERGFIYSTQQGFKEGESGVTKVKAGSGDGTFSSDISGLSPQTTYYYRAYGINETGKTEGSEKSFKTL